MEDNQLQAAKKGSNNKKIIAIILTAIIVIAVTDSATAILMNRQPSNQAYNQNSQTINQNKKGAYATYEGQATILSVTVSFNARMEIIDLNETHMQLSTYYKVSTP